MKPTPMEVARWFSRLLREELGSRLDVAVERNRQEKPGSRVCHTHDFCDSNVVMGEAMTRAGVSPDADPTDLWNEAWDIAKKAEFDPDVLGDPEGVTNHEETTDEFYDRKWREEMNGPE